VQKKKKCVDPAFLKAIRALPCLACGITGLTEAHHIKTKRCYGDDAHNVIPLCFKHHTGSEGWHGGVWSFLERFPHVLNHLKLLGWQIDLHAERIYHDLYK